MRALFMATLSLAGAPGLSAQAQTTGDIDRLNQAVQVCNSPMGAGMAECAKLRGQLGGAGSPGLGGAAGLAGVLGAAMSARQAPVAAPPPAANPQAIAACVRSAAGDTAAIQACLATAAPRLGVPALGQPLTAGAATGRGDGMAIYQGGQSYHACVAANPAAWQSCTHLLNGAAAPR